MGKYRILIEANGPHHTGVPSVDADALVKILINKLKATGHTISRAKFQELDFEGKIACVQKPVTSYVTESIPPEDLSGA